MSTTTTRPTAGTAQDAPPVPAGDTVIEVSDLWRRYGRKAEAFDAVRGVSFSVRRGEIFGLLGTNGAGKTSTVELLEGLAVPSGGTVRIFGELDPYRDRARVRPHTGVMLQEGGLPNDLTAAETLRMWSGFTTGARPIEEALETTGLGQRGEVLVKNLSGGEKRRLDLAMATLGSPQVLFLDEPTTGMDPEGRHATWDIISSLKERGTTIVLTTHYLEEAERLADHLAIMNSGRIAVAGTVAEIVASSPSTLSFRLPEGRTADELPHLPHLAPDHGVRTEDGRVHLATLDLQHTATDLLLWARDGGVALDDLRARSASLEEVFLEVAQDDDEETTEAAGAGAGDGGTA
ncbi:ABC transporter ATP-binding protein [Streptomyces sp. TR02-1]|uniref:ABC transporter ATP-binding protein n=1 Tax=Streptomyces sp. TR02-1 TaxID=3385977 RepID=UPI0039A086D3